MNVIMIAVGDMSAVPADQVKGTITILIGLIIVGLQIYNTIKGQKPTVITPDPLRIEKLDKFATRDFVEAQRNEVTRRLDSHDQDIRRIYDEMKAERAANQVHQSERSQTIFKAIDKVRTELTDKIDDMPDRIISMLNDLSLLNNKPTNHDHKRS